MVYTNKYTYEIYRIKTYYIDIDTILLVGVGTITAKLVKEDDVPKRFIKEAIKLGL